MSGDPTDSGIRRLMESKQARPLSVLTMNADWTNWEMHPAGDEILFMLEGEATFLLELADSVRKIELVAGRLLVISQGTVAHSEGEQAGSSAGHHRGPWHATPVGVNALAASRCVDHVRSHA